MHMNKKPEWLYLDLMKKTLSFILWPEPPIPIDAYPGSISSVKRFIASTISKVLNKTKFQVVINRDISNKQRLDGLVWPGYADTMIGLKRLDNLQDCIEIVCNDGVEGDFIETGVWRGGACIFMRAVLFALRIEDRKVFVADSFEGLPKPDELKYPADKGDKHHTNYYLVVSKKEVENNFRRYGLLDNQVIFLKGWFKDTLPTAPIKKLAILRVDGDMYGSTMESLKYLYPKLSAGGFCIIDDYGLDGCKLAVNDFRKRNRINSEIIEIDSSSIYWRKAQVGDTAND